MWGGGAGSPGSVDARSVDSITSRQSTVATPTTHGVHRVYSRFFSKALGRHFAVFSHLVVIVMIVADENLGYYPENCCIENLTDNSEVPTT